MQGVLQEDGCHGQNLNVVPFAVSPIGGSQAALLGSVTLGFAGCLVCASRWEVV